MINFSPLCTNLKSSLETIRSLKTDFDAAYAAAISSGTPAEIQKAQDLKQALETQTRELQERVNTLEAEHLYDLRAQYESQVTLLKRTGLIETKTSTNETGQEQEVSFMRDIHGNEHSIPSYETIIHRFAEQKELFLTKADQGFTKFLLVPFGMSLDQMIEKFRAYLLEYKKDHPEFGRLDPTKEDASDEPTWDPLWVDKEYTTGADVNGTLVYDPQIFDKEHHNGVTKARILERQKTDRDPMLGWRMLFLQTDKDGKGFKAIPRIGEREIQGEQFPRLDLETDKTPKEYLARELVASQNSASPYYGESGMSPEEWLVMFMSHLQETDKPIDHYQGNNREYDISTYLTGAYFPASRGVLYAGSYQHGRQISLLQRNPIFGGGIIGVRCAVRG
ncbi:hypothetical protein HYV70_02325 [Candidatus Uhrbacteria bacterium]|nr:hypothetical protein [Candidatus Uhrbacteria bacterium]